MLHHKTNQELMFFIDKAKAHLKAVIQLGYKNSDVLVQGHTYMTSAKKGKGVH